MRTKTWPPFVTGSGVDVVVGSGAGVEVTAAHAEIATASKRKSKCMWNRFFFISHPGITSSIDGSCLLTVQSTFILPIYKALFAENVLTDIHSEITEAEVEAALAQGAKLDPDELVAAILDDIRS